MSVISVAAHIEMARKVLPPTAMQIKSGRERRKSERRGQQRRDAGISKLIPRFLEEHR
jgi:hypothetical protein